MRGLSDGEVIRLRGILASPAINSNPISAFACKVNTTTQGVDVSFTVRDATGIASVTLLRSKTSDIAVATVLQTWAPTTNGYTWSDTDANLQAVANAYYWLSLAPQGASGAAMTIGPQSVSLSPNTGTPPAPVSLSAGHGASSNGAVPVYVYVGGVPAADSIRLYVAGYKGNAGAVAVASVGQSPATVSLQTTGETVTITAVAVNAAGVSSAPSPSVTLTLGGAATAAPAPSAPTVAQIASGNQVSFPASPDPTVTVYNLYRGQRTDTSVSATILATINSTGASSFTYLDSGGLSGDFAYYLSAASPAGTSALSPAGFPAVLYSSATIPPNVPTNTTNNATIDSIPNGSTALLRVYGPAGVGTSFLRYAGFGSVPRPNGTISGMSYTTKYAVVYDTLGKAFLAYLIANYPSTLPDRYEFVGYVTTTSNGSATGSGATATAVVAGGNTVAPAGSIVQVNANATGSGYSGATVSISGGGGSGAQVTANVSGGQVTSYTVTNGGSGYTSAPTVTVSPAASTGTTGGGGGTTTPGTTSPTNSTGGSRWANFNQA